MTAGSWLDYSHGMWTHVWQIGQEYVHAGFRHPIFMPCNSRKWCFSHVFIWYFSNLLVIRRLSLVVNTFPRCVCLLLFMSMQKVAFYRLKDNLLQRKRLPFIP